MSALFTTLEGWLSTIGLIAVPVILGWLVIRALNYDELSDRPPPPSYPLWLYITLGLIAAGLLTVVWLGLWPEFERYFRYVSFIPLAGFGIFDMARWLQRRRTPQLIESE